MPKARILIHCRDLQATVFRRGYRIKLFEPEALTTDLLADKYESMQLMVYLAKEPGHCEGLVTIPRVPERPHHSKAKVSSLCLKHANSSICRHDEVVEYPCTWPEARRNAGLSHDCD